MATTTLQPPPTDPDAFRGSSPNTSTSSLRLRPPPALPGNPHLAEDATRGRLFSSSTSTTPKSRANRLSSWLLTATRYTYKRPTSEKPSAPRMAENRSPPWSRPPSPPRPIPPTIPPPPRRRPRPPPRRRSRSHRGPLPSGPALRPTSPLHSASPKKPSRKRTGSRSKRKLRNYFARHGMSPPTPPQLCTLLPHQANAARPQLHASLTTTHPPHLPRLACAPAPPTARPLHEEPISPTGDPSPLKPIALTAALVSAARRITSYALLPHSVQAAVEIQAPSAAAAAFTAVTPRALL